MGLPIVEIAEKLEKQISTLTGQSIYLLSDFIPISVPSKMERYTVTIEIVRGYDTARVWTNTTLVILDDKFDVLEIKKIGEGVFWQNFYSGKGLRS